MDALYTCNIFPKYNNTGKISIAKHNNSEKTTSETKTKIMMKWLQLDSNPEPLSS